MGDEAWTDLLVDSSAGRLPSAAALYGADLPITDMLETVKPHLRQENNRWLVFQCTDCPCVALRREAIESHMRIEHPSPDAPPLHRCPVAGCVVASKTPYDMRMHEKKTDAHALLRGTKPSRTATARQVLQVVFANVAAAALWLGVEEDALAPGVHELRRILPRHLLYGDDDAPVVFGCCACPVVGLTPRAIEQHYRRAHGEELVAADPCSRAGCVHTPSSALAPAIAKQAMRRHEQTPHRLRTLLQSQEPGPISHIERRTLCSEAHNITYPTVDDWRAALGLTAGAVEVLVAPT